MIVIFKNNHQTRFQLDHNKRYKFCVHDFGCTFQRSVTKVLPHGTFLALDSNLVAKNCLNPCQNIIFFEFDANQIWQTIKFSLPSFDILSIKDLEYVNFSISTLDNEKIALKDYFVKIEILECQ